MRLTRFFFACSLAMLFAASAFAGGNPDYAIEVETVGDVPVADGTAVATVFFDLAAEPIDGWSFGICHSETFVDLGTGDIANGADVIGINGGGPVFFQAFLFPTGGWTVGVVVSFTGSTLGTGDDLEIYNCTYDLFTPGLATLNVCGTLGTPLVPVEMIIMGTTTVVPNTINGSINIVEGPPPPPPFTFRADDETIAFNPEDGSASAFGVLTYISESSENSGFPNDSQGFSLAIAYDDALVVATDIDAAGPVLAIGLSPDGPAFFGPNLDAVGPGGEIGFTLGVVIDFFGNVFVSFEEEEAVALLEFDPINAVFVGAPQTVMPLVWMSLGDPEVTNSVVVGGQGFDPGFIDGSVTFVPQIATAFIRGDANDDGKNDIADGIWILNELFQSGPATTCFASADANSDGLKDQSDAVYIFTYQFLDGPAPAAPFPACGLSATDEECEAFDSCL